MSKIHYTSYDIENFATYFKLEGVKFTIEDDYVKVVLRDDENFLANCSFLQDWAFDYEKCRSENIWEFHRLTGYGCYLWYKIMKKNPLRVKRPVLCTDVSLHKN